MQPEFDYIIVGAGSAGCVLANRLSGCGRYKVLLLEAGGSDRRFWIKTPIGYGKTFFDRRVNWCYETEPQRGLNGRTSYWPRGKVLGGSGSINAMVFVRGQQADYEDWQARGNPGWGWEDVLPYFRKMETYCHGGNQWRGESGPLYVNDPSADYHPLCRDTYIRAAAEYGLPHNRDYNGETQEGAATYQITTRNGIRVSTATAYLHPALDRPNLSVEKNAHATRILFEGRRATGIEYRQGDRILKAYATREIISSAGAINSPQLLQLSGIGPPQLLGEMGIDVVQPSDAVGRNLQDHLCYTHYYRSKVPTLNNRLGPWWGKALAGLQYVLLRRGPLSHSVNQAGGVLPKQSRAQPPEPSDLFRRHYLYHLPTREKAIDAPRSLARLPQFILPVPSHQPRAPGHPLNGSPGSSQDRSQLSFHPGRRFGNGRRIQFPARHSENPFFAGNHRSGIQAGGIGFIRGGHHRGHTQPQHHRLSSHQHLYNGSGCPGLGG